MAANALISILQKTKQNKTKQNKTKTKQNKTKQNKTKKKKTEQNKKTRKQKKKRHTIWLKVGEHETYTDLRYWNRNLKKIRSVLIYANLNNYKKVEIYTRFNIKRKKRNLGSNRSPLYVLNGYSRQFHLNISLLNLRCRLGLDVSQ